MRLIQYMRNGDRRLGAVDGDQVIDLTKIGGWHTTLELAAHALTINSTLLDVVSRAASSCDVRPILYSQLWEASPDQDSHLLLPVDHPDPHHVFVTGTGLTHTGSMQSRDQMHGGSQQEEKSEPETDSSRMFQMGIEGGKPLAGNRGVSPEWFYKGNGTILRGHRAPLDLPGFALDGGEEPELVGCYLVDPSGVPRRLGFAIGNEWSDHETEKINYLYLAPSKLRTCAIGPELLVDCDFQDIDIQCLVRRDSEILYDSGPLKSGEQFMCHSLENCEDHHFKYPLHRHPGDLHFHFFGTSKLSFSQREWVFQAGDEIEVSASGFAGPLVNPVVAGLETESSPTRVMPL